MAWQEILIIAVAVLLGLFTHKWWLQDFLNTLSGKRIKVVWAGKEYALTVNEAERVIDKQQSAFHDSDYGIFPQLMRLPNVISVDFGPKIAHGQNTTRPAIRVKVRKKLPKSQLRREEMVPPKIGSMLTDVVEVPD